VPPSGPLTLDDLPFPTVGEIFNVQPVSGLVRVGDPPVGVARAARLGRASQARGVRFVPLREARQLQIGSFLDVRGGRVRVRTAAGIGRRTYTGDFDGARFQVLQTRLLSGRTELVLVGSSFSRRRGGTCEPPSHRARGAAATTPARSARHLRRRTIRRLRGRARGRFRVRGRYSAATVRGTDWSTYDRCDGTLTRVRRGRLTIRHFRKHRNITLEARSLRHRSSYLARAPR
jgi:hypothetical protein